MDHPDHFVTHAMRTDCNEQEPDQSTWPPRHTTGSPTRLDAIDKPYRRLSHLLNELDGFPNPTAHAQPHPAPKPSIKRSKAQVTLRRYEHKVCH